MRSESDMLQLIRDVAMSDDRVRAVVLNGSRANPNTKRDIFQDYDVVYLVTEMDGLIGDRAWLKQFGERTIMQTPDENVLFPSENPGFAFLMLFADGNRIDLTLRTLAGWDITQLDGLSVSLLDKDGVLVELPPPSDAAYRIQPPSEAQFESCCNEFWWVSTYVAKGLWRGQLPYAKFTFDQPVRDMLMLMLNWYVGTVHGFDVNLGSYAKYLGRYLSPALWTRFCQTFAGAEPEDMWSALFAMTDLFRDTAMAVGQQLGYPYPVDDDTRVTGYLERVRHLPRDATEI